MSELTTKRADLYIKIKQAQQLLSQASFGLLKFGLTEEKQIEIAEYHIEQATEQLLTKNPYTFSEVCQADVKEDL